MRHLAYGVLAIALILIVPAGAAHAGWTQVTGVTSASLLDIWGSSASDIWAVGYSDTVLHYDGTTWTQTSTGTGQDLLAIWGSGASDIFAVGAGGTIVHFDGTSWSAMISPTTKGLRDVWGTSMSDVFAVGVDGIMLHYDGTGWSAAYLNSNTAEILEGVWAASPTSVFAVGYNGVARYYDGSSSTMKVMTGTTGTLYGVWGTGASNVYAVGVNGSISRYTGSGTVWTTQSVGATGDTYNCVWGTTANDIYVGSTSGLLHYDGTSWSTVNLGFSVNSIEGFWGSSASDIWAVGYYGTLLHYTPGATTTTTTAAATTSTTTSAPAGNTPPNAAFTVNPTIGDTSTGFILEPFSSSDAEDGPAALIVRIDWETDGSWDDQITADADIGHTYAADGTYTITIEVEDTGGLTDQATQQVKVNSTVPGTTTSTTPGTGGNTPPNAVARVYPPEGNVGTVFEFNFEESTDAEDPPEQLEGRWDFDSDGTWDTEFSTDKVAVHTYTEPGRYLALVEVRDTGGLIDQAAVDVMVGEAGCALAGAFDDDPQMMAALRQLRDERLAKTRLGRMVIRTYYKVSPVIGALLEKSPALRNAVKGVLHQLVD